MLKQMLKPKKERNVKSETTTGKGTTEYWCTTECRFCFKLPKLLSRIHDFEENKFLKMVLQRALFKILVITIAFES